jgi:UDP-N-acetylglucosamine--N-acetylmuramyl-(pentapeptide) pyrophosphoryl-undecaprenol N-acetylglucosamine transferase
LSTLLVASTGGHLKQLHQLHGRLEGISGPFCWATFDTPQSRSLLEGEAVDFVPFVGGRDPVNVMRNFLYANRILKRRDVATVVSTGSAIALPFFVLGRARGLSCHYIESAARSQGPSMTGKLIRRVPGVHRYSQYERWAGDGWGFGGAVFDRFQAVEIPKRAEIRRAVVTLGTYRGYQFPRLIERLLAILPADADVLWQTGETDISRFGIEGHEALPEKELTAAMKRADVVVAHAGVGAALAALEVGKRPVLVPRRLALNEHVDDHQIQIAAELAERGVAYSVEASELTLADLIEATGSEIRVRRNPPPFRTARGSRKPL